MLLISFCNLSVSVDLISQEVKQVYYAAPVVRLDDFLERLFCFRIGRRLLIDHLLASELPQVYSKPFDPKLNAPTICRAQLIPSSVGRPDALMPIAALLILFG